MKTRLGSILVVVSFLITTGIATADVTGGRASVASLSIAGDSSQSELDRRLAVAMARMDENLLTLLAPTMLDCSGEFVLGGTETCVARLDASHRAEYPSAD